MPSSAQQLNFAIRAVNEATKAIKDVQEDIKGLGSAAEKESGKLGKFGGALTDMGKIAGGFLAAQAISAVTTNIVGIGKSAISMASDTAESLSKVRVVFGENARDIERWAQDSATSMGIPRQAALAVAGDFGNLFVTMGLTGDQASKMSIDIGQLGADLGSFNNIDPTVALEKLRAGLVGEAEPLRALGINLNAAAVEAKAMEMGLADADGQLSESAKVQARYALIVEQSKTAQGDFARTSDGLANQQRILSAEWQNAQAALGSALLPALTQLALFTTGTVIPAIREFKEKAAPAVREFFEDVKRFWEENGRPALDNIMAAWKALEPVIRPLLNQIANQVETTVKVIKLALGIVIDLLGGDFSGAWNKTKELLQVVVDFWRETLNNALDFIKGLIPLMRELGEKLIDGLWEGVKWVAMFLINWFRGLPGEILDTIGDLSRLLYDVGKQVIQGFIDGLTSMFGTVKDTLGGLTGSLTSWKGPEAVDKKLLFQSGEWVMEGFMAGILAKYRGGVVPVLQGITAAVESQVRASFAGWSNGTMTLGADGAPVSATPSTYAASPYLNAGITYGNQNQVVDLPGGGSTIRYSAPTPGVGGYPQVVINVNAEGYVQDVGGLARQIRTELEGVFA